MVELGKRQVVWEILAQFWVDTWYDAEQLDAFAARLADIDVSMDELNRIVYWDVCGAFATFTLAVFLSAGMALPDWYYPEDDARRKVASWVARPKVLSVLNPIWILGYLVARSFVTPSWLDLRARVAQRVAARPNKAMEPTR